MKFLRNISLLFLTLIMVGCSFDVSDQSIAVVSAPTEEYVTSADKLTITATSDVAQTIDPLLRLYETLEGVEITVEEVTHDQLADAKGTLIISDNIASLVAADITEIRELDSPLLASLAGSVPDYIYSADDVAFLPVGIDGYAYLCNTALLSEILSEDDTGVLADNLRKASGAQWETAMDQLYDLITANTQSEDSQILRLSSAEYTLPVELPESIENLVAPYALNLNSPDSVTAPLSIVLNGMQLQPTAKEELLLSYARFLEDETAMTATPDGLLERGQDLATLNIETAAALYEQDKVLFWRSSLSDAFRYLSDDALANTAIFPIKFPELQLDDITHSYTLSSAMTVTTPFVFAVAKTDDAVQYDAAMDFLVWFYYSETGKSYITDTLGLLEINHSTAKNPLSVQLADYIENNSVMADRLLFASHNSIEDAQTVIYDNYLSLEEWTNETAQQLASELSLIF